jgi:hypothetical protein
MTYYNWRSAVDALLMRAKEDVPKVISEIRAMCISGTSATCLLLDKGIMNVSRVARMYNFDVLANNANSETNEKKSKSGKSSSRPVEASGNEVPVIYYFDALSLF